MIGEEEEETSLVDCEYKECWQAAALLLDIKLDWVPSVVLSIECGMWSLNYITRPL